MSCVCIDHSFSFFHYVWHGATIMDVMHMHTRQQVITLFPDLTLAVEEGEPELAHDFFSTVKVGFCV